MDVDAVLALVGLEAQAAAIATKLSGGQRRRLDFGLALIGDPALIFLDEPTTGFDPAARRAAWEVISRLRALGKTILLTTHYMEEAEVLAAYGDRCRSRRKARHVSGAGPRAVPHPMAQLGAGDPLRARCATPLESRRSPST
jgi:energy-coupling factor transporter ATP-binding protein EcfA2